MFGSSALEVAIGVIFVYLLLSIICTSINEAIASFINKRGKVLFEGIKNLLNDPQFTGLAQQLYTHGLVNGISKNATDPSKQNRLPSYMSSGTFALALIDIFGSRGVGLSWAALVQEKQDKLNSAAAALKADPGNATLQQAVQGAQAALDKAQADQAQADTAQTAHLAAEKAAQAVTRPSDLANLQKASALLQNALAAGRALAAAHPDPLGNIRKAVENLPAGHTRESLLVLVDKTKREAAAAGNRIAGVEHHIELFRENIEHWYDDAMDRFGGWYKRWTQLIVFLIATVIVLASNADTIMLAQRLTRDEPLRASIVAAADKASRTVDPAKNEEAVQALLTKAKEELDLPLGWSEEERKALNSPMAWMLKVFGLLISVFAVSLGAPFWFDVLSKLTNLRGAGTPPGERKKSAPRAVTS